MSVAKIFILCKEYMYTEFIMFKIKAETHTFLLRMLRSWCMTKTETTEEKIDDLTALKKNSCL